MMPPMDQTRTTARFEICGVVVTGLLHLLVSNLLDLQGLYIAAAMLFWIGYGIQRVRRDRGVLSEWGLGRSNLVSAFRVTSIFALVAVTSMAAVGVWRGTLTIHWHLLVIFLVYPLWGIIQQTLVQALVARNLAGSPAPFSSPWFIVPFCAVLFGLVHLSDPALVAATALLGLVFTPIYLKWRNLWPLGLYHGWLGALFYAWVLGRDPWTDIFG